MVVDPRDIVDDLYDFQFQEGTNKAILSKPVLPAVFRLDKANIEAVVTEPHFRKAHDVARSAVSNLTRTNTELKKKRIDVVFPKGYRLSQRPFNHPVGREDEWISAVGQSTVYRKDTDLTDAAGQPVLSVFTTYSWRFVNMQTVTDLGLGGAGAGAANVRNAFAGIV